MADVEQELQTQAMTLREQAVALKVQDPGTFAKAGEMGKAMKDLRAKVIAYFSPLKDAAFKAHKAVTAKEAEELKPIDEALSVLRDAMNGFTREQERIRREAEEKLRREAEAERLRLQKIENEKAEKERQRLMAQAQAAEAKGKAERAEALLQKAVEVKAAPVAVAPTVYVAPVIAKTTATASGNITQAKELQISVVDLKAFLAELVRLGSEAPMISVNAGPLKAWVKANGLKACPGLSITETTGVRF